MTLCERAHVLRKNEVYFKFQLDYCISVYAVFNLKIVGQGRLAILRVMQVNLEKNSGARPYFVSHLEKFKRGGGARAPCLYTPAAHATVLLMIDFFRVLNFVSKNLLPTFLQFYCKKIFNTHRINYKCTSTHVVLVLMF